MIAHMTEPRSLAYLQTIGSYCFRTISRSSKSGFVPTARCQPGHGVGRGARDARAVVAPQRRLLPVRQAPFTRNHDLDGMLRSSSEGGGVPV
jgi:hypothetical protein